MHLLCSWPVPPAVGGSAVCMCCRVTGRREAWAVLCLSPKASIMRSTELRRELLRHLSCCWWLSEVTSAVGFGWQVNHMLKVWQYSLGCLPTEWLEGKECWRQQAKFSRWWIFRALRAGMVKESPCYSSPFSLFPWSSCWKTGRLLCREQCVRSLPSNPAEPT